jgi:DNA-directed RNA polymerase specialized sigma subunit
MKKGDIAKKLGISQAAVSRRISYIISKLEEGYAI